MDLWCYSTVNIDHIINIVLNDIITVLNDIIKMILYIYS